MMMITSWVWLPNAAYIAACTAENIEPIAYYIKKKKSLCKLYKFTLSVALKLDNISW